MSASHARKRLACQRIRRAGSVLAILLAWSLVGAGIIPHGLVARTEVEGVTGRQHAFSVSTLLTLTEQRAKAVELRALALEAFHDQHLEPLIGALLRRSHADAAHVTRIAIAIAREGLSNRVDPRLLLAVMLVENPWLDASARSPVGAVGLMQVMPFHAGGWGCSGDDLRDPEDNICHGARILAAALRETSDLDAALLRYNGCILGTSTPDCHSYPSWVYRRAGAEWMVEIMSSLTRTGLDAAASSAPLGGARAPDFLRKGAHDG